jgi:hypothetical protein
MQQTNMQQSLATSTESSLHPQLSKLGTLASLPLSEEQQNARKRRTITGILSCLGDGILLLHNVQQGTQTPPCVPQLSTSSRVMPQPPIISMIRGVELWPPHFPGACACMYVCISCALSS